MIAMPVAVTEQVLGGYQGNGGMVKSAWRSDSHRHNHAAGIDAVTKVMAARWKSAVA